MSNFSAFDNYGLYSFQSAVCFVSILFKIVTNIISRNIQNIIQWKK